nr:MAG TPA: hypothetical protein [Caudoviricetes sp.]
MLLLNQLKIRIHFYLKNIRKKLRTILKNRIPIMKKTIFDITIKKDGTTIGTLVRADIVEFGGAVDDYNISSTGVVESVKANGYGTYNIVLKL